MTAPTLPAASLPLPPARAFLVGIGGIGMSGLAQYLQVRGYSVAGSDRLLDGPGREDLVGRLRRLGIAVFPQDGRGPREFQPDLFITSAAVEPGNPDLLACPACPVCPRARALAALLEHETGRQIAVAGSAGKTTVTGWLATCLRALGYRVLVVDGGYMLDAESAERPGNFAADPEPEFLVVEVDESDKSLVEFRPHVGVVLNVGTDHYDRAELLAVFGRFLDHCQDACVLPADLAQELAGYGPPGRVLFSAVPVGAGAVLSPSAYTPGPRGAAFQLPGVGVVESRQFGQHSAANATAVLAALQAAGVSAPATALRQALAGFRGIRQRFEFVGTTARGTPVYNDYAHNVQKIAAALDTARDAAGSPLLAFFQPHGYGPFGFMREALRQTLAETLRPGDRFVLLPVYYAGGSSSFTPSATEVATEYAGAGLAVEAVASRDDAVSIVGADHAARAVLVMGARDPSLPDFAAGLCAAG